MKVILGVFFASIVAMVLVVMFRLGSFKSVHVTEIEEGPFHLIYKKHVGPYHQIVPTMNEVEEWVKKNNLACPSTFGEFLDNPKEVDQDRLQSNAGCVVDQEITIPLPEGFVARTIERQSYVSAVFDGAPSISPYKVYPKVFEYFEKQKNTQFKGPALEIYTAPPGQPMTTKYLFASDMTN